VRSKHVFLALFLFLSALALPARGDDWLPITSQELSMKESALSPGAHAVMLFRQVETDDVNSVEYHYYRIKVLTETGKKYADVELPYFKGFTKVGGIKARTVRPDGSELKFNGQVFDKVLVKARGVKVQAKTFTLPEVQVGSILEYRFDIRWPEHQLNSPSWEVQHELPTHRVNLVFKPWPQLQVSWTYKLPGNAAPNKEKKGRIELVLDGIPGFRTEEYMPPEKALMYRVDFFYFRQNPESVDEYWKDMGKSWHGIVEDFIGKRKGIQQAVTQLVAAADSPEAKLFKIYERVQQVRNLSYERSKSEKEEKREKLKDNNHVDDVLKNGYGYRNQINRLFVALARAAGFDAWTVLVAERDVQFFEKELLSWRQLDGEVAAVRVGQEEKYFDPGTPGCPFGMLAWLRSAASGIRPHKDGAIFVTTPQPVSLQAVVERKGTLRLDETGTLEGKVSIRFHGLEGLTRRLSAMENDDTGRRKELEDEIKAWLPTGATIKLGDVSGWESFEQPLQAEVDIKIPEFAVAAGRRNLLTLTVFQANETHPFRFANRIYPVYLRNPYREIDDLTFEIPSNFRVESVPQHRQTSLPYISYQVQRSNGAEGLRLQRTLTVEGYFFPVEHYPHLRTFFSQVRAGDEEQVVLQGATSGGNNEDR